MQSVIGATSSAERQVQRVIGLVIGLCFMGVLAVALVAPEIVTEPGMVGALGVVGIAAGAMLGCVAWSSLSTFWLELYCVGLALVVTALVAWSGGTASPFAALFFLVSASLTLSPRRRSASLLIALAALLHSLPLGYSTADQSDLVRLLFSLPIHVAIAAAGYVVQGRDAEHGALHAENAATDAPQAARDPLTGLRTRATLVQYVQLADAGAPFSIILLGVDRWQMLCDKHGRKSGDDIIRQLAVLLQNRSRSSDIPVRYDEDMFAIIFPGASAEIAMMLGERLRDAIEQHRFWTPHSSTRLAVSISLGVGAFPQDGSTVDALVNTATNRLETLREAHGAPLGAVSI